MSLTRWDLTLCATCDEPLWVHHEMNELYDGHVFVESDRHEDEDFDRGWSRADLLFGGNW